METNPLVDELTQEIAKYGVEALTTKELAPTKRMVELLKLLADIEQAYRQEF